GRRAGGRAACGVRAPGRPQPAARGLGTPAARTRVRALRTPVSLVTRWRRTGGGTSMDRARSELSRDARLHDPDLWLLPVPRDRARRLDATDRGGGGAVQGPAAGIRVSGRPARADRCRPARLPAARTVLRPFRQPSRRRPVLPPRPALHGAPAQAGGPRRTGGRHL